MARERRLGGHRLTLKERDAHDNAVSGERSERQRRLVDCYAGTIGTMKRLRDANTTPETARMPVRVEGNRQTG